MIYAMRPMLFVLKSNFHLQHKKESTDESGF